MVSIAVICNDGPIQFHSPTLTANIVTMSVFGAIVMDIISLLALGDVYFLLTEHQREIAPAPALLEK